jgi:hypothetical protein
MRRLPMLTPGGLGRSKQRPYRVSESSINFLLRVARSPMRGACATIGIVRGYNRRYDLLPTGYRSPKGITEEPQ